MLKNSQRILCVVRNSTIFKANLQTSANKTEKWDLLTAVLIERKPIISRELTELEKDFKDYLSSTEYERSLKSDIEIKLENEKASAIQKKENDLDMVTIQSTQDFIDACKDELSKFTPADRKSNSDADLTSLQRLFDRHLIFVVNQKLGDKTHYLLPQGKREDGETLRQCAERVLKENCGNELKAQFFGNAPSGFYKYKYPKSLRSESSTTGAKVFIYFARYLSGQIPDKKNQYKWLSKQELDEVLFPEAYKKSVLPILLDDE